VGTDPVFPLRGGRGLEAAATCHARAPTATATTPSTAHCPQTRKTTTHRAATTPVSTFTILRTLPPPSVTPHTHGLFTDGSATRTAP
jgi:hypothetical protein